MWFYAGLLLAFIILETYVVGPIVAQVNECIYLAKMINKLYHKRKVAMNETTGIN